MVEFPHWHALALIMSHSFEWLNGEEMQDGATQIGVQLWKWWYMVFRFLYQSKMYIVQLFSSPFTVMLLNKIHFNKLHSEIRGGEAGLVENITKSFKHLTEFSLKFASRHAEDRKCRWRYGTDSTKTILFMRVVKCFSVRTEKLMGISLESVIEIHLPVGKYPKMCRNGQSLTRNRLST